MQITINTPRYKGSYEIASDEPLLALEWRWIKKISGYLPLTISEGLEGGDPDVYLAFAVIALHRAGKVREEEVLVAAKIIEREPFDGNTISVDFSDEDLELAEGEQPDPEA